MQRGRKKTVAGKIRDCLKSIRYWDKHPDEFGAEHSRPLFVKAIKGHLAYADGANISIPEDLRAKALAAIS